MKEIANTPFLDHFRQELGSTLPDPQLFEHIKKHYLYCKESGYWISDDGNYKNVTDFRYMSKVNALEYLKEKGHPELETVKSKLTLSMLVNPEEDETAEHHTFNCAYDHLANRVYPIELPTPDYSTIYVSNTHLLEHFAPIALNHATTQDAEYDAPRNKQTIIDYIRDNYRVHQVSKTEFYYATKPSTPEVSKKQSTPYVFYIRLDHERSAQRLHINKQLRKYLNLTLSEYRAEYLTFYNTDHSIAVHRTDIHRSFKREHITKSVQEKIKRAIKEQINFHNVLD